jgi:hypothetical protein
MIVSEYRRLRGPPSVQPNVPSTTRLRGTCPAESSLLGASGLSAAYPSTSGPNVTSPLIARA